MKIRTIYIYGFEIHLYNFGYAQYLYPAFNGNAEFNVSKQGFKKLKTYLKNIKQMQELIFK